MKRRLLFFFLDFIAGKLFFQRLFIILHNISIYGMNYGNGGYYRESGELNALTFIKSKLKQKYKQLTIFDVGANVGSYALQVQSIFEDTSYQLHCFEPSIKTFEQLVSKTSHLQNVKRNNLGLSDVVSSHILYSNTDLSGLASLYNRRMEHFNINMSQAEEISLTTLDTYAQTNHIDRIHFLKLDIEGHELRALKGATFLLTNKKIDFIQFEFGGSNIDSKTYFQDFWYLLKDNYQLYRIVKDGLYPIQSYNETDEIFKAINYLAMLK